MTDHFLMLWAMGLFGSLHILGVVLLGLQLREAQRATERLSQTMARMALGLDALARRLP